MVTIQVVGSRDGKPRSSAQVAAYYGMLGNYSEKGDTDSRGEVHLDLKPGEYHVPINGSAYSAKHHLQGRTVIYIE